MKTRLLLFLFLLLALVIFSSDARANSSTSVLITAVYYDPFILGEASEAVQLQNTGNSSVTIGSWTLTDGEGAVSFPADVMLNPGQKIWVSQSAVAFQSEFGFLPDYEYGGNTDPTVPDMNGSALSFANAGDEVILQDDTEALIDAIVYGNDLLGASDWVGMAVHPYKIGSGATEGQMLHRKMQEADGKPVPDTNTRADWAQDPNDPQLGKRVLYPGWRLDEFFQTTKTLENATIKFCVAPDHLYNCVRDEINAATKSIAVEIYSFDNANLVDLLIGKLNGGVKVSLLLDGGALENQGKWACQQIEAHGGECWLMASKPQSNIHKRYDNLHAKWMVVDGQRALIGTENLSGDGMPADDKRDGTFGSRGGYLITTSPTIVAAVQATWNRDFDSAHLFDVRRWGTNTDDFPPLGFVPNYKDGGNTYPIRFPNPFTASGAFSIELLQCPENCLRQSDALLGLIQRARAGDTLDVEELYEYPFWGIGASNAMRDPNVRLEAYIAAARRGAHVRILLDSFFDVRSNPRSNYSTCLYVNGFDSQYDIQCRLGNPTGQGIHSKMVLLRHGGTGFVHLGSINGSETASKLNRELATQVESLAAFNYLENVFEYDWATTRFAPHRQFLPFLLRR
ncbi:MAG TPA: phospholipase D-like domain-containing protein [Anaerolineae bacterium]|nr:phospholipase D-like domain-containing protein [Anaerolineae bacterium]